ADAKRVPHGTRCFFAGAILRRRGNVILRNPEGSTRLDAQTRCFGVPQSQHDSEHSPGPGHIEKKEPGTRRVRNSFGMKSTAYRLENWNRRRAPRWPYFLRSFMRLSRVRKPAFRRACSRVLSYLARARPRPMMMAPAWPVGPPPLAFTRTSILPPVLVTSRGPKMAL